MRNKRGADLTHKRGHHLMIANLHYCICLQGHIVVVVQQLEHYHYHKHTKTD